MRCNIDRRGRSLRTGLGIVTAAVGAILIAGRMLDWMPSRALTAGIAAIAGGAFMIFEGVNGWCAVRAMGFKTPV